MIQSGPKMTQNGPQLPQMAQKWRPDLRTFFAIFFDWKSGSANFFAFRMYDLSQEGGTHKFFHWGWSAHQRESQPFPLAWERRFLAINQWHLRPGWEGNVEHLYEEVPVWESWLIFQNPWYLQSHLSIFPSGCLSMHMSKYSSTSWKKSLNFMWLKKSSGAPHR